VLRPCSWPDAQVVTRLKTEVEWQAARFQTSGGRFWSRWDTSPARSAATFLFSVLLSLAVVRRRLVDVSKFRVQVAFEAAGPIEGPMEAMEVDPFRPSWGPGHVYSLLGPTQRGPRELVVCAVVAAGSPDEAC
jgi:hypothetical protein